MNLLHENRNRFGFLDMDQMVENAKRQVLIAQTEKEAKRRKEASMTAKERKEQARLERAIETEGFSRQEVLNSMALYEKLAPGDMGKVSIKSLNGFLETVVKPRNPEMYQRLVDFFDTQREKKSERKEKKEELAVEGFLNSFRTIENAFKYSLNFKAAAISIAPKLDAPEYMTVIERVKWLRVWIILIADQSMFWSDYRGEVLVGKKVSMEFDQCFIFPEIIIGLEKSYFRKNKDKNIKLDLIRQLLSLYPENVQKEVMRFGEFGYDTPDCMKMNSIRLNIKKKLFEHDWIATSSYFCTEEGIRLFEPEVFMAIHEAIEKGGIKKMPKYIYQLRDPFSGFKTKKIIAYKIESGGKERTGVCCQRELEMYIKVWNWIKEHPNFRFGKAQKTLSQYGLENLFGDIAEGIETEEISFEDAVEKIILDCNLVTFAEDIDWDFVYDLLNPENKHNIKVIEEYLNGEIEKGEFLKMLGFFNEEEAKKAFFIGR